MFDFLRNRVWADFDNARVERPGKVSDQHSQKFARRIVRVHKNHNRFIARQSVDQIPEQFGSAPNVSQTAQVRIRGMIRLDGADFVFANGRNDGRQAARDEYAEQGAPKNGVKIRSRAHLVDLSLTFTTQA